MAPYGVTTVYQDGLKSRIVSEVFPGPGDTGQIVLRVGPVLGPFQCSYDRYGVPRAVATVLVEFNLSCKVKCNCVDVLSGVTCSGCSLVGTSRPSICQVAGLRLGRRYSMHVVVNEVEKNEQTWFHTPDSLGADVNICFMNSPTLHVSLAKRLQNISFFFKEESYSFGLRAAYKISEP